MKKIFLFFIGYACASVSEKDIKKFTSLLFGRGVNVFFGKRKKKKRAMSEENTDTGNCVRVIKYREKDHDVICGICAEEGIKLYDVKFYGIPQLFRRYGKRYGFYVGISVFIAALMFANNYVWRIEIYGNEKLTDEEVIDELERNGFRVGTNYKDVDFDVFHNRFLAASEDIAWLSVNMNGSVAYVEIREFLPEKEKENADENKGANIVASCDGKITQISAFHGSPAVSVGEEVKKGQLLISGAVSYEGAKTEFLCAEGEVYAETVKTIRVEIPLVRTVKRESEERIRSYGIKFFSDEIFFGGKGRIDTAFYDTITMYKSFAVKGCAPLPAGLIILEHTQYSYETETISAERASVLAYAEYKRVFCDAAKDVTLLSYETVGGMNETNDAYVITSVLNVIDNIAEEKEFIID